MKIKKILEKKLENTKNDKYITKNILEYLGNYCEKCYEFSEKKLIYVLSFNDGVVDYNFKDRKDAKYGLKKFCEKCIFCKASQCRIYVEI